MQPDALLHDEPPSIRIADRDEDLGSRHSKLGIASFVLGITASFLIYAIAAGLLEPTLLGAGDEDSPTQVLIGLVLIAMMGALIVALGLGIGGLMQGDRKKTFAVVGTITSALFLVGTFALLAAGSML